LDKESQVQELWSSKEELTLSWAFAMEELVMVLVSMSQQTLEEIEHWI
jgi:hypothetical protein